ncbi:uncharacterized protein [Typha angustifolia]|uniref:uncharacterized protein n=1 Tax=Typha angustifolia TaxID=59011 RepID=UPI003C2DD049
MGTCQAGAGAIIRDNMGRLVMAWWEPTPVVSPLHAEAWAMRMGLGLLRAEQRVEVESDSEWLVKIMREEHPCPWQIKSIVRECKANIDRLAKCTLGHVRRTSNRVADWATHRGLGAIQIGMI